MFNLQIIKKYNKLSIQKLMVNLNPESFKLRVMGILSIVPYKSQIVLFYDNNVSTSRVQYLQETRIFIDLPNSQPV